MAGTMASLFGNNPLATPVGHKIEQATEPTLASEDWGLNMEICDMINETEDGARDAARAIKKRLHQFAGKNYTAVLYTLTVLETCVKNCGKRFHHIVCSKDYIQDLIKLIGPRVEFVPSSSGDEGLLASVNSTIMNFAENVENAILGPKNDPPLVVQEKVLGLVQSWANAFRNQPEMSGVVAVYTELLAKGVEFPDPGEGEAAPIHTPSAHGVAAPAAPRAAPPVRAAPAPAPAQPAALTAEQVDKLKREIVVVDGNIQVFNEMLSALKPTTAHPDDLQLLQQLAGTCRTMQQRLVELVGRVSQDEVTAELLRVNDELNNCFIRYERFERSRTGGSPEKKTQTAPAGGSSGALIDLGTDDTDTSSVAQQMAGLAVGGGGGGASQQLSRIPTVPAATDADFDELARGRSTARHAAGGAATSTGPANTPAAAADTSVLQREQDFDEMEQWLRQGDEAKREGGDPSMTSTEFDRFLAERAAAAERQPPGGDPSKQ